MNHQVMLDRLRAASADLKQKYGLQSLGVFGSTARGDGNDQSDVDVLVSFKEAATFDAFMGLKLDLEDLFERRVDLGTPETLRPEMRSAVEKDLIHVA